MQLWPNVYFILFVLIEQHYYTQHVLIRLLEDWRRDLDNNFVVGGVFFDLSKTFGCIPHDLLITKFEACGFDDYLVHYIYSYLDNTKQCVWINNKRSSLQNNVWRVAYKIMFGPTLFNSLFNDFFLVAATHNYEKKK